MGSFEIDFHGFDEDIKKVITNYPDETKGFMRKQAGKWKNDCNNKGYKKYKGEAEKARLAKKGIGKEIKPIPKCWKIEKEENILHEVNEVQIRNTSRIFHLVENGHVKWVYGKNTGGFVPGKHWAEKTRAEWQDKFGDNVTVYLDQMLKDHKL